MAQKRPERRGRPPQRRAARGGMPPWMPVVMIGFPLVAILAALILKGTMSRPPEEPAEEVTQPDPNAAINRLTSEVPELQREGRAVMRALREDATAEVKMRAQRIQERIDKWMERWDQHFEPLRDEDGQLPPEYQGYGPTRSEVNQLRVDLLRVGSF